MLNRRGFLPCSNTLSACHQTTEDGSYAIASIRLLEGAKCLRMGLIDRLFAGVFSSTLGYARGAEGTDPILEGGIRERALNIEDLKGLQACSFGEAAQGRLIGESKWTGRPRGRGRHERPKGGNQRCGGHTLRWTPGDNGHQAAFARHAARLC
jgi:hypothetical protein